jgi:hypothetical protein
MATSANSKKQIIFPSELDGTDNVSHIRATGNEPWPAVDHTIVNFASRVVSFIVRLD